ncbi:hypothetical protein AB0J52_18600 [Spirillospora sp. NPDC049652]
MSTRRTVFKRWLTLGGTLVAAVGVLTAPAQAATRPPLQKITDVKGPQYQLTEKYDSPMSPPPGYEQVGIDGALSGDGRTALMGVGDAACPKSVGESLPKMKMLKAFCWDKEMQGVAGDVTQQPWVPQGIATSGEARAGGVGAGKRAAIAGWNWQNDDPANVQHPTPERLDYRHNSVKLAFANLDDGQYRWVLPVWDDGTGNLRRVYGHGGGLAWYGKYLFMANTSNWNHQTVPPGDAGKGAVRVFDTTRIYRRLDGRTGDFQYVMPEVRRYTFGDFQPDYVSLDRNSAGGASLVVGTFQSSQYTLAGTRIVRYDFLDYDYRLAATAIEGWRSTTPADKAYAISDVQGVQADGDTLYINMSGGWVNPPKENNRFAVVKVKGDPSTWTISVRKDWAEHPEDLAPWYEAGSPYQVTELWGLTEAEQQRAVFAVAPTVLTG